MRRKAIVLLRPRYSLPVRAALPPLALGGALGAAAGCSPERAAVPRRAVHGVAAAPVPRPAASPAARVFTLSGGPGVERELVGGRLDAYEIDLVGGEYLYATFDQRGIDVAVNVFGPDHRPLFEVDGLYGPARVEKVHLVAETAGRYRLEVSCSTRGAQGRYMARIEGLRPAGPADRMWATAERAFYEARGWQGQIPGFWEAVAKFERSLLLFQRLGAQDRQAEAYYRLGKRYLGESRFREALELFEGANGLYRELHDRRFIALSYNQIGWGHPEPGECASALPAYRRAMAAWNLQPLWPGKAVTLENLGEMYAFQGRSTLALHFYRQAVELRRTLRDRSKEANAYIHMGWVYRTAGDRQRALASLRQALDLAGRDDARERASALKELGNVLLDADEPRRALPLFQEALTLQDDADPETRVGTLTGLGVGYRWSGEYAKAIAAYRRALDLSHAAGNRRAEANTW